MVINYGRCLVLLYGGRLVKYIYNLLHTNNSTVQSIVNSKLLLYPNSVLSENYKYLMSKYKISHLDLNLSLLYVLNKIEVPPLSNIIDNSQTVNIL